MQNVGLDGEGGGGVGGGGFGATQTHEVVDNGGDITAPLLQVVLNLGKGWC